MELPFIKKVAALGLLSGGLDSLLAARIILEQGIQVTGVAFESPFFGAERARVAAKELGIDLIVKDLAAEHLAIVKKPRYGYGANMNPCLDCHALMIREAGKIMQQSGFDFIFTGEVLNQRPMSQTKRSLVTVAKHSGYGDRLLRPLSARLLPETTPERTGLVDRQRLLDFQGRSRKRQLALASKYGLKEYSPPAGGCLLTDPNFSKRLKELFDHDQDCSKVSIELLKLGRHFRMEKKKIVVGRNNHENAMLKKVRQETDVMLSAEHVPGPIALVCGGGPTDLLEKVAGLCWRYSDAKGEELAPPIYEIFPEYRRIPPQRISESDLVAWIL